MRFLVSSLACAGAVIVFVACTKKNPEFCSGDAECDTGSHCNLELNKCEQNADAATPTIDATGPPDAGQLDALAPICEPATQSGCDDSEKCTWVWDELGEPVIGHTDCATNGSLGLGDDCTIALLPAVDDCVAGTYCFSQRCTEICGLDPDTCISGTCRIVESTLSNNPDIDSLFWETGAGLCLCNPLLQDCPFDERCVIVPQIAATPLCLPPAGDVQQGEPCSAANVCAEGYGCLLPDDLITPTTYLCAFFCDAAGGGGPTCLDGPGAGFTCEELASYAPGFEEAPPEIGLCVPL